MERTAREIRLRALRDGSPVTDVVERMLHAVPDLLPLEAHRWARGWGRAEVSTRMDLLYEEDGLAPPGVSDSELCRWEHGQRRPSDERIDYLCRVYGTRPDRLGFGRDYSGAMVEHLEQAGIVDVYPRTGPDSKVALFDRVRAARTRVNMFGLTRNFYGSDDMLSLLLGKSAEVPIRIYVMDPYCASRRDRYRLEPAEAAMEDPDRYTREILGPLAAAAATTDIAIYLYNFPCSFAIEEIDDVARVMLYGHGMRGTDGPILTFAAGTEYHDYFTGQMRWLERLAEGAESPEPWRSKDVRVWRYEGS